MYTHIFMCIYNYTLLCCLLQGENKGCSFHGAQCLGRAASGTASAIYIPIYLQLSIHLIYVDIIYTCIYIYTYIYIYTHSFRLSQGEDKGSSIYGAQYTYIHTRIYTYRIILLFSVCHRRETVLVACLCVTCFSFYRGKTKAALFTVLSAWDKQRAALQALFVYIYTHISIYMFLYIYLLIYMHTYIHVHI